MSGSHVRISCRDQMCIFHLDFLDFLKKKHVQFSGSPRKFLIQKYSTMTAVGESDSSLAAKCLDICQVLAGQGVAFNFSLSIGSNFSFSLDARGKGQALATQGKT